MTTLIWCFVAACIGLLIGRYIQSPRVKSERTALTEQRGRIESMQKRLLERYKTERTDLRVAREHYEEACVHIDNERRRVGECAREELKDLRDATEAARILYITKADELQQRINSYNE